MKRLKEENVELLQRKRITYILEHEKKPTPSNQEIIKDVAKDLNVSEELIKIRHIYSHFGVEKAKIIAHVYENKEALKKFEEINKKKKVEKKEEGKTEEAPKAKKVEVKESGKEESKK